MIRKPLALQTPRESSLENLVLPKISQPESAKESRVNPLRSQMQKLLS
jgi:hypothetical protein